jgi:heme A synthase
MDKQAILNAGTPLPPRSIARFAWAMLGYNLLVILWGVYVRASGSGAGCGGHWPTCNGQIIPTSVQMNTIIEFTHRVTSGLTLILSLVFVIWAWRVYQKGNPVRLFSALVLLFTLTEALIGAGLVLFGLVANNDSVARAVTISLHLVNTLFLIGCISLAAWYISFITLADRRIAASEIISPYQHRFQILLAISLAGMLLLGVTGTVTALGDTLFPASSLAEGLKQDVSPLSSFLIRLRVIHPILAVTFVSYSAALVFWIRSRTINLKVRNLANLLLMLLLCQLALGATNVLLLAPVWLQLVHLLTADLVWIVLVLFSAQFLWIAVVFHQGSHFTPQMTRDKASG